MTFTVVPVNHLLTNTKNAIVTLFPVTQGTSFFVNLCIMHF